MKDSRREVALRDIQCDDEAIESDEEGGVEQSETGKYSSFSVRHSTPPIP